MVEPSSCVVESLTEMNPADPVLRNEFVHPLIQFIEFALRFKRFKRLTESFHLDHTASSIYEKNASDLNHRFDGGNFFFQGTFDPHLQGHGGHRAGTAGPRQPHTDHPFVIDIDQFDIAAVGLQERDGPG